MTWPHIDPDFRPVSGAPEERLQGCGTCEHKRRYGFTLACGHPKGPQLGTINRTALLFGCAA